ncbi:hypothetical protein JMJ35_001913 [Cladonia borealis]|uniref:Uncharacterized protein n=1 Tax=Cladonia borealis TaxID=184061 RepID=A0AA39V795_9LECA|nr:hypothetical protein JMJ35_001913 [Cladonia borealis]
MYDFPDSASFLIWLLCLPLGESNLLSSPLSDTTITVASQVFIVNPTNVVLNSTTIAPGSSAVTIGGEAVSADVNHDLFIGNSEIITGESVLSTPINTVSFSNLTTRRSGPTTSAASAIPIVSANSSAASLGTSSRMHVAGTTGLVTASNVGFPSGSQSTISSQRISSNELPTIVSNPSSSTTVGVGLVSGHSTPPTSVGTTLYTIDGVTFTGNSQSLAVASTTLTPGGSPLTLSSHTFSIPISATGNIINIDGDLTILPLPTTSGASNTPSATTSSTSQGVGLGPGFGPVGSITLSDASTTATYDAVLISQYSDLQTPTVIVTSFPEYNSNGSITSVQGSVIIGKGGTALIHPPSIPTLGGKIAPPGFGGPIRPPSGVGGCPSFFGISFCPPGFSIDPPGSPDLPPAELPDGPDPDNPDNSENNEDNNNSESQNSQSKQSQTRQSISASSTQPPSISASTSQPSTSSTTSSTASSSVTSTCSACDSCVTYDYSPTATPNPVDDDTMDMRKRELAGRFIANKRGIPLYSSATIKVASAQCAVSKYTNKPPYPGPGAVANNAPPAVPDPTLEAFYQTATYWAVPTNPPKCGAPGWQFMDSEGIGAYSPPWKLGGTGKSVNIDHVYEVSLLDEFFTAQVSAGFTCGDISKLFDVSDPASAGTRLNTIFAQLPSVTNPDFLGMDSALNRLKGALWNPDLTGVSLSLANSNAAIQSLSNLAVVMDMANNEAISKLFSNTNARIFQAFQGIDLLISSPQGCSGSVDDQGSQPASNTWASAYSVWITGKVSSQNDMITKTASSISAAIATDAAQVKVNQAGQVKNWSKFVDNFNAAYNVDALTFPQPDSWPQNAINIAKRQAATTACTGAHSVNPSASVTASSTGLLSQSIRTSLASSTDRSPSTIPPSTVTTPPGPGSSAPSPTITSAAISTAISSPVTSASFSCTTL